ncbi:MAG: PstS family phosphate ABC transporter substrate-binding protein [Phycisphaerae bacterium]
MKHTDTFLSARTRSRLLQVTLGIFILTVLGLVTGEAAAQNKLSGKVKLDGSSTVAPITMAAAEMFQAENPGVRVTVGISGTGGGFKKFLDTRPGLRTDISDASRPIKKSELAKANKVGVRFIEVPIGIDGIAVVLHPSNSFCDYLTVKELKKIWEPGSEIKNWRQIRKGFPDLPLKLYGPGTDSGTFDYFTKAIVGKEKASRSDYTASESDNVLVQGVEGDPGAIGYFGYSYYEANKKKLKLVGIDSGDGKPVRPNLDVIRSGVYKPLSRPLFLYVNAEAYKRAEVRGFLEFFFKNARRIVEHPRVNYVALSDQLYQAGLKRLHDGKTGSAVAEAHEATTDLNKLFVSR